MAAAGKEKVKSKCVQIFLDIFFKCTSNSQLPNVNYVINIDRFLSNEIFSSNFVVVCDYELKKIKCFYYTHHTFVKHRVCFAKRFL